MREAAKDAITAHVSETALAQPVLPSEIATLRSVLHFECSQMHRDIEADHVRVPVELGVIRRTRDLLARLAQPVPVAEDLRQEVKRILAHRDFPHVQAAFINAIREEGTKDEACTYLQREWDKSSFMEKALRALSASLQPQESAPGVETLPPLNDRHEFPLSEIDFTLKDEPEVGEYRWDAKSRAAFRRNANGTDSRFDPLPEIAKLLTTMLESAVSHGADHITGYTIKTGALHRILGLMMAAGFPVTVPPARPASEAPARTQESAPGAEQALRAARAIYEHINKGTGGDMPTFDAASADTRETVIETVRVVIRALALPAAEGGAP